MEANEMEPGTRDQGGQALEEFERCHDDMRGAIAVGGFELQDDVAFLSASQPFVGEGGTGDVTAEAFEGGALMGAEKLGTPFGYSFGYSEEKPMDYSGWRVV